MLELEKILMDALPKEEEQFLEEHLKGKKCLVRYEKGEPFEKWLSSFDATKTLLVSENAAHLKAAQTAGMAALGYLNPDVRQPDGELQEVGELQPAGNLQADMFAEGFEEVDFAFLEKVYRRHHGLPWTILTTKRCIVREFCMDDLDDLFALYAGKGMTDYMEPLYEYEKEREYEQAYIEHMYGFYGYGMWVVIEKETGALIGRMGVEHREELGGELELGYAVAVPYQRKGYAAEVCTAIISYAKEELGVPFLNCLIEEGNTVSEHLIKRLGFSYQETILLGGKRMKKYTLYFNDCIL